MATATRPDPNIVDEPDAVGPVPRPEADDPIVPPEGDVFYEVVDGIVIEIPPMGSFEADIANLLAYAMNEHAIPRKLGRAFVEVLYRLDAGHRHRRQPDVAFVSASRWPVGKRAPRAAAWKVVPDIAVEVVSPTDRAGDLGRKIEDYFGAGVTAVWVIYPETRRVYDYASPTEVRILAPPDELDGGVSLPGFRVSLIRLFEDEPAAEAPSES